MIEIKNCDDLMYVLKKYQNNIITLCIILNDTGKLITNMIKKFLLTKSKKYTQSLFLFYVANIDDIKKQKIIRLTL